MTAYQLTPESAYHYYGTETPARVIEWLRAGYDIDIERHNSTLHVTHGEQVDPNALRALLSNVHDDAIEITIDQRETDTPRPGGEFDTLPARERAIYGRELAERGSIRAAIIGWHPIGGGSDADVEEWHAVCRLPWDECVDVRVDETQRPCRIKGRPRQIKLRPTQDGWTAIEQGRGQEPRAVRIVNRVFG